MMDMAFFFEMGWKSALIAGAALLLAAALRNRAAADRAMVLRIGVAMLLALPFLSIWSPALEVVAWSTPEPLAPIEFAQAAALLPLVEAAPADPTIWDDPTPLLLLAWLGGVLMLGGRLVAGLWTLRRWTRAARPVDCPEWLAAFERVRWTAPNGERIRMLVSHEARSPLSWGWVRPVVVLDRDTVDLAEDAEAILAHEVAHVARGDWPALLLSRVAAALFWFNPLVWLLDREVVQQAEEAADADAVDRVEPARYAQTLLTCAQYGGGSVPAHAIAPSARALARRVRAILDGGVRERQAGSAWTAVAILACLGIAAPVAALELVEAHAPAPPRAPVPPVPPEAPPVLTDAEAEELIDATLDETVHATIQGMVPQVPEIVASAMAQVDPDEIARTVELALNEANLRGHHISRAEIAEAMAEARAEIAEARAEFSAHDRAEIARATAKARAEVRTELSRVDRAELARTVREAHRQARDGIAEGASGMMQGAEGMERGAARMDREAARFRNARERQRIIAEAAAEGRTVTHEELIEAAESLAEGADDMRRGAAEMRASAQRMRAGRD